MKFEIILVLNIIFELSPFKSDHLSSNVLNINIVQMEIKAFI